MARTTELIEFRTGKTIVIHTSEEMITLLKCCNPMMIRHYQAQFKNTIIRGFGNEIKLERKILNEI